MSANSKPEGPDGRHAVKRFISPMFPKRCPILWIGSGATGCRHGGHGRAFGIRDSTRRRSGPQHPGIGDRYRIWRTVGNAPHHGEPAGARYEPDLRHFALPDDYVELARLLRGPLLTARKARPKRPLKR